MSLTAHWRHGCSPFFAVYEVLSVVQVLKMEDVVEDGDVDGRWSRRGAHYANIATYAAETLGQLQLLAGKAMGE